MMNNFITGEVNWVINTNYSMNRQQHQSEEKKISTPKPDLDIKKLLLSAWQDVHGFVYRDSIQNNTRIKATV